MLKSLLFSLLIVALAYSLRLYVDSFKPVEKPMANFLEGVTIKAYSKSGIEWTIEGRALEVVGKDVRLYGAKLSSEEAIIISHEAYIDRSTGEGKLWGGVELSSEDLKASTNTVYINLREGRMWGEEDIKLVQGRNLVVGRGFEITLRPLRIIISKAKVSME